VPTLADHLAAWLASTDPAALPTETRETARRLVLDVAGLCVAARHADYVAATLASVDAGGSCTIIGARGGFDAFGAALVNGTAAHGEDFDDTFEGGPVHAGAVVVPAVAAACERERLGGDRLLLGIVTGTEVMCRLSLVAPKATHAAGFHPTAVFGALACRSWSQRGAAAAAASDRLSTRHRGQYGLRHHRISCGRVFDQADARGLGSAVGIRAALMARGGFIGPKTVLEGQHGFYRAFAPSVKPDFEPLQQG
jgi:2-methylcitrate dehydratase PrpD